MALFIITVIVIVTLIVFIIIIIIIIQWIALSTRRVTGARQMYKWVPANCEGNLTGYWR